MPRISVIPCPFGTASTAYVYFIHTPRPVLIDTGVAASPGTAIGPALAAAGFHLSDVRWIVATHGHWDHIGGMAKLVTIGGASTAIHELDAGMTRKRDAHMTGPQTAKLEFIDDLAGWQNRSALLLENISGELAVDRELVDGERIDLGAGIGLVAAHTPGHSPGSTTFLIDGTASAFTGDAVQIAGSSGSSRFPLFTDPDAYRRSLHRLLEQVRPGRLYLGHRFLDGGGAVADPVLSGAQVVRALESSLAIETKIASVMRQASAEAADRRDLVIRAGISARIPRRACRKMAGRAVYDTRGLPDLLIRRAHANPAAGRTDAHDRGPRTTAAARQDPTGSDRDGEGGRAHRSEAPRCGLSTARGSIELRRSSGGRSASLTASPSRPSFLTATSQGIPASDPDVARPTRATPRPPVEAA